MGGEQPSIAKITRPTLPAVLPRERLFRLLDDGRRSGATWISGPPGSGKTTLVASYLKDRELPCIWYQVDAGDSDVATFFYYLSLAAKKAAPRKTPPLPLLTPEYLLDVPTFSRRYFENLCGRLRPPFSVVFDNYQEVPAGSPFHDIFQAGLSAIPEGIHAVIISRTEPLPAFTGMSAGNTLNVIGWDDLRLTEEESGGIVRLHDPNSQRKEMARLMYDKTDGWAAGLILIIKTLKREVVEAERVPALAPDRTFDYFANELFNRIDAHIQDFLLSTAILRKMTPVLAEQLSGNSDAARILSELNRRNYFTEKRSVGRDVYQYHPLFREFLLARAKDVFGREELLNARMRAAALLEKEGYLEDAVELYIEAQAWEGLNNLILVHAPALMRQTRGATLGAWLAALPQDMRSRNPWLLYWSGACKMHYDPRESLQCFEKAFRDFNRRKEAAGVFLSWAGAVNSIVYAMEDLRQLEPWIRALDGLLAAYETFPSKEVEGWVASAMVQALVMRRPDHRDFESWKNKALLHVETRIPTLFHLAALYVWRGNSHQADEMRRLLNQTASAPEASPLGLIFAKLIDLFFCFFIDPDSSRDRQHRCIQTAYKGLEISEKSGIHILDFMLQGNAVIAACSAGDAATARSLLQKMSLAIEKQPAWNKSMYYFAHASEALSAGDSDRALMHAEASLRYTLRSGVPMSIAWCYYVNAQVRHERGDIPLAYALLEKGFRAARKLQSALAAQDYLFIKAYFDLCAGKKRSAHAGLRRALTIGRERSVCSIYTLRIPRLWLALCAEALEAGIEAEYVRNLVRSSSFGSATPPLLMEHWPWPVKIYTLGRFRIDMDDAPLEFPGKAQKKPLDMLKALIAFGGKDVSEEQITSALWPDAEGDLAHKSFEMTLQRLRRMFGWDDAIKLQGGNVSLDERMCWTDVRAYEQAVAEAERVLREKPFSGRNVPKSGGRRGTGRQQAERGKKRDSYLEPFEKAIKLYQGQFLPSDGRQSWSIVTRERLRSKFIRLAGAVGKQMELADEWASAADLYEKCLEIDGLAEQFYQSLMVCYQRLGQEARAVMTYHRCKTALLRNFGINPSSKTEAVYRQVRGER